MVAMKVDLLIPWMKLKCVPTKLPFNPQFLQCYMQQRKSTNFSQLFKAPTVTEISEYCLKSSF